MESDNSDLVDLTSNDRTDNLVVLTATPAALTMNEWRFSYIPKALNLNPRSALLYTRRRFGGRQPL
ncbi:hypothetical protein [[Phormidium] sp. ETS-05]|uniref:hypothetical protein n=1 Tax=[Phormidium] sp. ETS-05 TaxID=222819 RepID=UPI0018EEF227|nr:hypothetical protein [[Phormidium] sp. ETS-05]